MYKIKEKPEDFFVKEILKFKKTKGEYSYFLVRKRNWNTLDVVRVISKKLRNKEVRYAGLKDKNAITEQYISVKGVKNLKFRIKDVEIKKVGESDKSIILGGLEGNQFKIVVRNLVSKRNLKIGRLENYFDKQRFSSKNVKIGKALLKRDYKKLVGLLGVKDKPGVFNFDKKILKFALNSFQSYVFNEALKKCIDKKLRVKELPLVNFDTEFSNKKTENIYNNILEKEGVAQADFIFKEMPFLVSEGVFRDCYVKVEGFKYNYTRDELNKNKFKCVLSFKLVKGSYGTLVVKKLFSKGL